MKRRLLTILSFLSVLAGVATVAMWVRSFQADVHLLSFTRSDARYTLKSSWGRLVFSGPPTDGAEDVAGRDIASRMSNDDFEWKPSSERYLEGTVRQGSATRQMFDHIGDKWESPNALEPAMRAWLGAMEDPHRWLPAHLMLCFAADKERKSYFNMSQPWHEANWVRGDPGDLIMFGAADRSQTTPDMTRRIVLLQQWHDVLDTPKASFFLGWVVLASLFLPLLWITRPRWRPRTLRRWAMNALALVSVLLCMVSAAAWIRSYWVSEEWVFASLPAKAVPNSLHKWTSYRFLGSSNGRLLLYEEVAFESPSNGGSPPRRSRHPMGYQRKAPPTSFRVFPSSGMTPTGERLWTTKGIEYHVLPAQVIIPKTPTPVPGMPGVYHGNVTTVGFRSLVVSWWIVVAVTSILPVAWVWRWWVQRRQDWRNRPGFCQRCGYDLRATPDRCPECGTTVPSQPLEKR